MTPRERILTALDGGKPDRVPLFWWGVDPYGWISKAPGYTRLAALIRTRGFKRQWRPPGPPHFYMSRPPADLVVENLVEDDCLVVRTTIRTPRGPLTEIAKSVPGTNVQVTVKHLVQSNEDLNAFLCTPDPPYRPDTSTHALYEAEVGEAGVLTHRFYDALGLADRLVNPELLYTWVLGDPPRLQALLEVLAARIAEYVAYLLQQGVKPVFVLSGAELATPPMMGPQHFYEYVARLDRPLIEAIRAAGGRVIIHCHGRIRLVLDQIVTLAPHGLHPIEEPPMGDITLDDFRANVGNRIAAIGNLQIGDMYCATPAEIAAKCRRIIDIAGKDGALLVSPTATPYEMPLADATFANYVELVKAVDAYG